MLQGMASINLSHKSLTSKIWGFLNESLIIYYSLQGECELVPKMEGGQGLHGGTIWTSYWSYILSLVELLASVVTLFESSDIISSYLTELTGFTIYIYL